MTLHLPDLASTTPIEDLVSPQKLPQTNPTGLYRNAFKRILDVGLVLLAAPFVLPLLALMTLLVAMNGQRPFYSQLRVGQGGRHFRMWKMRTMVRDADTFLERYLSENPAARAEWDATQKLKDDPRITRVGRILRKTSMDELPQLFNVLNGTMSLVGPRPMMVDQKKYYYGQSYFNLRPGITGFWQIADRNHCDFVERVAYDDLYDRELSLLTDVRTLRRTVGVVLRATGY